MELKTPSRRATKQPIGGDFARAASRTIEEAWHLKADFGRLQPEDQHRLFELVRKVTVDEKPPADAAAAEAFVEGLQARKREMEISTLSADTRSLLSANADLLMALARRLGREPTRDEEMAALENRDPAATLATLRLPEPLPNVRHVKGVDLSKLDAKERARFEKLVEVAAGREPGSVFERERAEQKRLARVEEIAASMAPGPRKRRRVDVAGAVVIPPEFYADMLASSATHLGLTIDDLAVFSFLSLVFETRRLPAFAAKNSARFEGRDGNVLQVRRGMNPFGHCNVADAEDELMSGTRYAKSLKRLGEWGWLIVQEAVPGGDGWARIIRGPKLEKFLADREEVR